MIKCTSTTLAYSYKLNQPLILNLIHVKHSGKRTFKFGLFPFWKEKAYCNASSSSKFSEGSEW